MRQAVDSPFRPVEARRTFEYILEQLETAIAEGHFAPGGRLPSERELAELFQVSRASVREALRVLEALGVVAVRRGADHGSMLRAEPGNAFTRLLRLLLSLRHISLESVIDFRALIERWAAGTVATRRDPRVLDELAMLVRRMEKPSLSEVAFHELDASFHLLLVRACENELATLILDASRTAIQRIMLDALRSAGDWDSTRRRLVAEHRAILDAIERGDAAAAAERTESHIRGFYRELARSTGE